MCCYNIGPGEVGSASLVGKVYSCPLLLLLFPSCHKKRCSPKHFCPAITAPEPVNAGLKLRAKANHSSFKLWVLPIQSQSLDSDWHCGHLQARKEVLTRSPRRCAQICSLQNCEKINICYFKPSQALLFYYGNPG